MLAPPNDVPPSSVSPTSRKVRTRRSPAIRIGSPTERPASSAAALSSVASWALTGGGPSTVFSVSICGGSAAG